MLDYLKIIREAEQLRISPHLLVKRKINYRKAKPREMDCRLCLHLRHICYQTDARRKQCAIVGEGICPHADVDHLHICDCYEKNQRGVDHDYKKFIEILERKNESD